MAAVLILCLSCVLPFAASAGEAAEPCIAEHITKNEVRLPVLMYHDVYGDGRRYSVTPERLDADLTTLESAGYEYVSPADAEAYVQGHGELPDRPVMPTFDDGHYNNYSLALPVLTKHGACATFAVVGSFADRYGELPECERGDPAYSCMTWADIAALPDRITIAAHSYDMHSLGARRGILPRAGESDAEYRRAVAEDTDKLNAELAAIGVVTDVYAFPFGFYTPSASDVLQSRGYGVFLTCDERVNTLRRGGGTPVKLSRFNMEGAYTDADLLARISR